MTKQQKLKELTRLLYKWNCKEINESEFAYKVWVLFKKEALETWNDPLEKLIV